MRYSSRLLSATLFFIAFQTHAQPRFSSGQSAEVMLSGIDFNNSGGALLFNHPSAIASDGARLFLCDRWNNRVLIWNATPTQNTPPDIVLGQSNFLTNNPGSGRAEMNWPGSIAAAQNGTLAIADTYNDRILLWRTIPTTHAAAAEIILELRRLSSGPKRFEWPWGVWTDGVRLAVVATHGASILFWKSIPTADNQPPDFILSPPNMGTPRTITSDGTYFTVSDHNSTDGSFNGPGTFFWKTFPTSSNSMPDFYRRDWMKGCITPDGKLVMASNQTLSVWNSLPQSASTGPDATVRAVGYSGGDGADVILVNQKLYVNSYNGNKILGFNAIPTSANATPDFVIGAPDAQTNTLLTNGFITNPVIASNGTSLFVTSDFDRRLWVWTSMPAASGTKADAVAMLPDAPWQNALFGDRFVCVGKRSVMLWDKLPTNAEQPSLLIRDKIGSAVFQELVGVAMNATHFFLSDASGTIWVWQGIPSSANQFDPIATLRIDHASRLACDETHLVVTRMNAQEISIYRIADVVAGSSTPLKKISGQPLNLPMHAILFDGCLAIANTVNNAVYVWKNIDEAGDYTKCVILGAESLQDFQPAIGRKSLFWPGTLCFDGTMLWVGEFKFSNRILGFKAQRTNGVASMQPDDFNLSQNFPNPFSDKTTIELQIPDYGLQSPEIRNPQSVISFKVFDVFGREVLDMSSEAIENSQLSILNSQLPRAGVYFYRLTIGNSSITKTMIHQR